MLPTLFLSAIALCGLATARYPPPVTDAKVFHSKRIPGVSVSYRSPKICEETPGVKQYSGYVHIPPNTFNVKQEYPLNMFFWFFEAHKKAKNAPLTVWMNGGPGSSSMHGLFEEIGPCDVAKDSKTTIPREWAWNKISNMIFIDQPVQVGFSYDTLHNGTWSLQPDEGSFDYELKEFENGEIPENNSTFFVGTFPSLNANYTTNTTSIAAEAFWTMMQGWTEAFPQYSRKKELSIYAQSYGGHYGPRFSVYTERQNDLISTGHDFGTKRPVELRMNSLGIVSGCIEYPIQYAGAYILGVNNTYSIPFLNQSVAASLYDQYTRPGGCRDAYLACQALFSEDPYSDQRLVDTCIDKANEGICSIVNDQPPLTEFEYIAQLGRNRYDFTHNNTDPFPYVFWEGLLMDAGIQKELGVPVNFSASSSAVAGIFDTTRDRFAPGFAADIAYLLEKGVKVTLIYGDKDFACNWIGGEMTSLAINYTYSAEFAAAGYAKLYANDDLVGGEVRQHGKFSFVRIYDAGHAVPAYSPETSFRVFERTLKNLDVATGKQKVTRKYATRGPSKSTTLNENRGFGESPICYIPDGGGCTEEQIAALAAGTAVVENYIVVEPRGPEGLAKRGVQGGILEKM